jgi:glutaredoxin
VIRLTIYSRPGCHLCDDMKAIVERVVRASTNIALEEIDITSDPALEAAYGIEIPVLMIGGKKAAKYRISEQELRRRLTAIPPA